jgi:hypothetical protein
MNKENILMKKPTLPETIVFSLFMAICMSAPMSFVMTWVALGIHHPYFVLAWLRGFGIGMLVSFPVALLVVPLIRRLVDWIFKKKNEGSGEGE